jgi:hypothetical protein
MSNNAYQVTEEDVENVLRMHSLSVANTNGKSFESIANHRMKKEPMRLALHVIVALITTALFLWLPVWGFQVALKGAPAWIPLSMGLAFGLNFLAIPLTMVHGSYTRWAIPEGSSSMDGAGDAGSAAAACAAAVVVAVL